MLEAGEIPLNLPVPELINLPLTVSRLPPKLRNDLMHGFPNREQLPDILCQLQPLLQLCVSFLLLQCHLLFDFWWDEPDFLLVFAGEGVYQEVGDFFLLLGLEKHHLLLVLSSLKFRFLHNHKNMHREERLRGLLIKPVASSGAPTAS